MKENKDKPFFQDSEPDVAYFLNTSTGNLNLIKIDFANNIMHGQTIDIWNGVKFIMDARITGVAADTTFSPLSGMVVGSALGFRSTRNSDAY